MVDFLSRTVVQAHLVKKNDSKYNPAMVHAFETIQINVRVILNSRLLILKALISPIVF